MSTDNKHAPKVRSGDEVHPLVASIVKIGGLIAIAALAVVITFILLEVFKKEKDLPKVYEDNYHLSYNDFTILTSPDVEDRDFASIKNEDIREVLLNLEQENYYIYFYYSSSSDKISKEEVLLLTNMDKDYPLFFVDLDSKVNTGEDESGITNFKELLNSEIWNNSFIEFQDDKNQIVLNKEVTKSFIIELDSTESRELPKTVPTLIGVYLDEFIEKLPQQDISDSDE